MPATSIVVTSATGARCAATAIHGGRGIGDVASPRGQGSMQGTRRESW